MAHVWVDVKNARYAIKSITRIFVSLIGKSYKITLRGIAERQEICVLRKQSRK